MSYFPFSHICIAVCGRTNGAWVKFQSSQVTLGYLGQSATGSDSRRTPGGIAWLIDDTDPLGTHNGIAWLTGANNLVGGSDRDRETPCMSPVIDRTIWVLLPLGEGPGESQNKGHPKH